MDSLIVKSDAFVNNDYLSLKYTCDGDNVSPSIEWSKGPETTKSYALVCDDPDAPSKVWVHWVMFNIPPTITKLDENIPAEKNVLGTASQGTNDSGELGYSGPCPPSGIHHYHFKVYALDCILALDAGTTKAKLETAIKNHVIAFGKIIGLYKRAE